MTKYTEVQMENYIDVNEMYYEDLAQTYRKCSCCNYYVEVDNQSSEVVINDVTNYDICDECSDNLKGMVI